MTDRLPSLPLFVDDYEAATAHLSLEEDGAYMRLLRLCWRSPRCSIPDDPTWIMRHMRVDAGTYERLIAPLIAEFFSRGRGRVFQKRLLSEFGYAHEKKQRRKEAGKKGGTAKAQKTNDNDASNATALPEQNSSNALARARVPNPNPNPNPKIEEPDGSSPPVSPPKSETAKGHRLAPDWQPATLAGEVAAMVASWPAGAIERELSRFRDWAAAATGSVAVKRDWDAAWRNWLRKANDDGRIGRSGNGNHGGFGGNSTMQDIARGLVGER